MRLKARLRSEFVVLLALRMRADKSPARIRSAAVTRPLIGPESCAAKSTPSAIEAARNSIATMM